MKKGAIFDMDGLLFDTEKYYQESWVTLAGEFGVEHKPEFLKAVSGTSKESMFEVIRSFYPTIDVQEFVRRCLEMVEKRTQVSIDEKPGLHEILTFFRENGVRMAIGSSSTRAVIENNLRTAGITDYFDCIVSGQEIKRGKPDPEIFLLAAKGLGLSAEDCYVFEDAVNGIRAGAAAGCAAVMIPDLAEPTQEIYRISAGVYESLNQALLALRRGEI
ncbi:MAG: HAD family phosphatase [Oscillibacter sp.]|nr:HAD family phosphatase [Lachnospiraceae bacterium]MCI9299412.1 HAD family phosphatase [Oscillibacter sp.]